jgi:hypothetical protein
MPMAPMGRTPWDDLQHCPWMLDAMEKMVDSRLFKTGTGV